MCGSNDFVKEDGLFVCQSCGTKYSVEEARKLMIEGTVEVTGTVQVDNTTTISNFLSLAEDALEKKDLEAVNDYIKRILEMNPKCTEARLIQFNASTLAGDDKEIIKTGKSAIKFASDDDKARVESKIYFYFAEKAITVTKTAINLLQWTYSNEESIKKLERLCSKANSYMPLIQTLDSKIDSTNAMLRGEQDSFMYLEAIPTKTYAEYSTIKDRAENWLDIQMTKVDNSKSQGYSEWNTDGGNSTEDRIFLLSYAEANRYLGVTYDDSNNLKSRVAPTDYALAQGAYTSDSNKTVDGAAAGWWWLRSPGLDRGSAAGVSADGSLSLDYVIYGISVVRPAFWLNLESDIF